jgi:MYXO-CTERM domain-containing protein
MFSRTKAWARTARFAIVLLGAGCALCAHFISPAFAQPPDDHVVPPGQEALLADMLGHGAPLPAQCRFTSGQANGRVVLGAYTCPGGEVVIELRHPSTAAPDHPRTEQFAVAVRSGTAPAELITALMERIRAREDDFEWVSAAKPAPPGSSGRFYPVAAALLAAALLFWVLRRRRSAAQRA